MTGLCSKNLKPLAKPLKKGLHLNLARAIKMRIHKMEVHLKTLKLLKKLLEKEHHLKLVLTMKHLKKLLLRMMIQMMRALPLPRSRKLTKFKIWIQAKMTLFALDGARVQGL